MDLFKRAAAVLVAGALTLSIAGAALAQQQRGRRGQQTIPPAFLARLNLTDEQKTKIEAAGAAYRAEQQKLQALTPQERRTASRTARETYEAAVKGTLTPEQQTKLTALQAEAREYRGLGPVGPQLVALDLTAEQKTKLKAISDKYQPEQQKLREAQRGATDRQAIRAQQQELNAKITAEVTAVLTPEQQKQLQPTRRRRQQ